MNYLCCVFHRNDNFTATTGDQIHCSTHALHQFALQVFQERQGGDFCTNISLDTSHMHMANVKVLFRIFVDVFLSMFCDEIYLERFQTVIYNIIQKFLVNVTFTLENHSILPFSCAGVFSESNQIFFRDIYSQ